MTDRVDEKQSDPFREGKHLRHIRDKKCAKARSSGSVEGFVSNCNLYSL